MSLSLLRRSKEQDREPEQCLPFEDLQMLVRYEILNVEPRRIDIH